MIEQKQDNEFVEIRKKHRRWTKVKVLGRGLNWIQIQGMYGPIILNDTGLDSKHGRLYRSKHGIYRVRGINNE